MTNPHDPYVYGPLLGDLTCDQADIEVDEADVLTIDGRTGMFALADGYGGRRALMRPHKVPRDDLISLVTSPRPRLRGYIRRPRRRV